MDFNELFSADKIYITVAVIATLLLFLVSVLVGVTNRRRQREAIDRFKYRPRKHLMVGPTRQCFQILNDLFGQRFYIIPEVSLSSLLSHKVGLQDRYAAYRFIDNKTVDFVLCNKRSLRPICAVKLEEGVQNDLKQPGSDPHDMEKFFRSAHIPFIYLTKTQRLTPDYIIEEFSRVVYETSKIQPASRGRKKKSAPSSPANTAKTTIKYQPQPPATPKYFESW